MGMFIDVEPLVVNTTIAEILGLNNSIIIQQLHYWVVKNKKNNHNFYDGRYWVFNSYNEWAKVFPFWGIRTIKRIFKELEDANIILTSNYNKMRMDRTKWYTLNYEKLEEIEREFNEKATVETIDETNECSNENYEDDKNESSIDQNMPNIVPDCHNDKVPKCHNDIVSDWHNGKCQLGTDNTKDYYKDYTKTTIPYIHKSTKSVDGKSKEDKKIKYAEFVTMTNAEHEKLVSTHGEIDTQRMIEILDNWKGQEGKTYKSDYRAILSWVVKALEEEKQRSKRFLGFSKGDSQSENIQNGMKLYEKYKKLEEEGDEGISIW